MARDIADELLQAKVKARLFGGDHAPRIGRLVILDRIGSGAMGAVYAAYDPRLDRRVAVKVLHAADDDANARWLAETRALGKLAHPNVIAIHDADLDGDSVHIVMELAAGTPLRAWIHNERTWRDVVRVMRDAAKGLAAAHRAGIVHRDVKPDNIIVGEPTRVVDFGLAQTASDDRDAGAGTPSYMAPEVLAGKLANTGSDQFSFGVTLFEALYGERPHAGTTRDELREAALLASSAKPGHVVSTPADATVERKPDADADRPSGTAAIAGAVVERHATHERRSTRPPAWVHAIVKRTLAADPVQRFTSMDDVVVALSRDRRRARLVAIVAGTALVVGAIGGGVAMRATDERNSCDAGARVAAAWNPPRADRVRTALGDAPWAPAVLDSLARAPARWNATFRAVCEATHARGEQSDRLLELRMRCLDRALDRFTALAAALEGPLEPATRVEAPSAIAQLPAPEACTTMTDPAELALPTDPKARARVLDAQHTLDLGWTNFGLSRYREARAQVLAVSAEKLDAEGVRAELAALSATIEARIGEPGVARSQLEHALAATAKARAFDLEYAVWTRMLRHELFAGDPARALAWEPFARAAAARAGLDGAELDGIVGEALRDAGQYERARITLAHALDSTDPLRGDQRAIIEMNAGSVELAMGQPFLAQTAFERALALAKSQLGDGHPSLAIYRDKLAEADRARGRIKSALAHHDASIQMRTAAYGTADRSVATARFHRAETLLEAGQLTRAHDDLNAALAIRTKLLGESSPRLGEIYMTLGDLEQARGKSQNALAHYAKAATLDGRLDLRARRAIAGETIGEDSKPPPIDPFSVERAQRLVTWIANHRPVDLDFVVAVERNVRSRRTEDPTLLLAAGDVMMYVNREESARHYHEALAALPDEPSRMRLHALRGLAAVGETPMNEQADALARQMPELAARW